MRRPDPDDHRRSFEPTALLRRLSLFPGSATLRLDGNDDPDLLEAFPIAVLELTSNPYPCVEQDELVRTAISRAAETPGVPLSGCGVTISRSAAHCEIWHGSDETLSGDRLAAATLALIDELRDPAGMIVAGLAAGWGSMALPIAGPSIRMSERR